MPLCIFIFLFNCKHALIFIRHADHFNWTYNIISPNICRGLYEYGGKRSRISNSCHMAPYQSFLKNIMILANICLHQPYFFFKLKFYKKISVLLLIYMPRLFACRSFDEDIQRQIDNPYFTWERNMLPIIIAFPKNSNIVLQLYRWRMHGLYWDWTTTNWIEISRRRKEKRRFDSRANR